jgi:hypothetical protein
VFGQSLRKLPRPGELLEAEREGTRRGSYRRFIAVQNSPNARVAYEAVEHEDRGRVSIGREAIASGGRRTIHFVPSFAAATVDPPSSFHGRGIFERRKHARGSRLGDLTVDFPDETGVSVAGGGWEAIFHSNMCCDGTRDDADLAKWVEACTDYAASLPPKGSN